MDLSKIESAHNLLILNNEPFLAKALLAKELQTSSHNYKLIERLGHTYLMSKDYVSATKCFSELKLQTGSFESHFYLAKSLEGQNEFEQAKEAYLDALLISTIDMSLLYEAYKNVGNLYLKEKNIDVAEDFYHKAYALNPNAPQLAVNMGTLELQKGDISSAIEKFRKALRIDTRFTPAWIGLALSYQSFGDFDMAWASALKAIETDAKNTTALLLIAQWSPKQGKCDVAIEHLMNFFDLGEFDAALSFAFVELCIGTNNYFLARLELERALLWNPQDINLLKIDQALKDHGY